MTDVDIAIIGGGIAGLSAAIYTGSARLNTLVFERRGPGGQLVNVEHVENYPGFPDGISGYELGANLGMQAMNHGAEISMAEVAKLTPGAPFHTLETSEGSVRARAVIIAVGSSPTRLEVPGEADLEGRGVSFCATCDGGFFRGQRVAVVGGGDTAADEALYLADLVERVYLISRRAELRAQRSLQERVLAHPKIQVRWNTLVDAIVGDTAVRSLTLQNVMDGSTGDLQVAALFECIGLQPETRWLTGVLPLDPGGHLETDVTMATSVPGLFAVGDIRQHSSRQLASAAGDGVTAALSVERYIRGAR